MNPSSSRTWSKWTRNESRGCRMLATDIELREELHALAARSRRLYPLLARRLERETGIDCGYREQPFLLKRKGREHLFPAVGQIDPRRLTTALMYALHARGISIEEQVEVTRIEESDDFIRIESNAGTWTGRTVTVAAGRGRKPCSIQLAFRSRHMGSKGNVSPSVSRVSRYARSCLTTPSTSCQKQTDEF